MDVNEDNTLHKFRKTYNDFAAFSNVYECINLIKISSYNTLCAICFILPCIAISTSGHGNRKHMTYPMDESNPKEQDKVKHRTHTITDRIPSGNGNVKHMAHPMDKSNPKGQDKVKHRTHTITDRIPSGNGNVKHMALPMDKSI
jgi:hypothetical protein